MGRGFWVLAKVNALRDPALTESYSVAHLFAPASTVRFRHKVRSGEAPDDPDYPMPAVYVDYLVPKDNNEPLSLEFFTADGERVNGYTVEDSQADNGAAESRAEENMRLSTVEFIESAELTSKPGLNRFAWDMRYAGAWHKDEDRRFRNGPLIAPGEYIVRLQLGEQSFEQRVEVIARAGNIARPYEKDVDAWLAKGWKRNH